VIFLVGLVTMILMRTLRKDYARYSKEDEMDDMERDLGDEYGWKQVQCSVQHSAVCSTVQCVAQFSVYHSAAVLYEVQFSSCEPSALIRHMCRFIPSVLKKTLN
jgi:hypothetical protein